MSIKTLIVYSSIDGQTLKICQAIKEELQRINHEVALFSIEEFNEDVSGYEKLVIGSSIRYGVHHKKIIDFINAYKHQFPSSKTSFFSVNLVARKPEKNTPETNTYVKNFLRP